MKNGLKAFILAALVLLVLVGCEGYRGIGPDYEVLEGEVAGLREDYDALRTEFDAFRGEWGSFYEDWGAFRGEEGLEE